MPGHIVVVSGAVDSGKTHYVRTRIVPQATRLVVVDPMGEYDVGETARGFRESLAAVLRLQEARVRRFRLSCRVRKDVELDELLRAVWGFQEDAEHWREEDRITLVVDEADLATGHVAERGTAMHYLCNYGKRVACPFVLVTRRLARIHRDATANVDRFILFAASEPADLEDMRKRRGPEVAERMRALTGHQFIEA